VSPSRRRWWPIALAIGGLAVLVFVRRDPLSLFTSTAPIQIVDAGGEPVRGALLRCIPDSRNDPRTDDDGRARLENAWLEGGLVHGGGWLRVLKHDKTWWFTFPLPVVVRLDPADAYPRSASESPRGTSSVQPERR
jgi:hypothetical protein